MELYEVRSIMNSKPRKITASEDLIMCLQEYKKLMEKNNLPINELDLFYAGYVIANPILRERTCLKNASRKLKEKRSFADEYIKCWTLFQVHSKRSENFY